MKTELSSKIENIQKNITQVKTINQAKDSVNKALESKSLKEIEEAKVLVSKMDDSDLKKQLSEQLNKAEAALKETDNNTNVNTNTNTNTKPESNTKPVDTSNKVDAVLPNVGISNNFVLYATLSMLVGAMAILVDKKRTVK